MIYAADQFEVVYIDLQMKTDCLMSKSQLLQWVKNVTRIPANKLEDLSTGVHFCTILHVYTKEKFSLHRVKLNANNELDSLHNLKILQYGMEEHKIPYKFDIVFISKKNFRAILEMLQLWRKLFQKLPKGSLPSNYERQKEAIQLIRPLKLTPEQSEIRMLKVPEELNHKEVINMLQRNNRLNAPKEPLIVENDQTNQSNKQNQTPLYSNPFQIRSYDPFRFQKEEAKFIGKTENKIIEEIDAQTIPPSKNKLDNFSFGIQTSPSSAQEEKTPQERNGIKTTHSQQKGQKNEVTLISTVQQSEARCPEVQNEPQSLFAKKETRTPMIQRQAERLQATNKASKSRQEYFSSRPKSIPKAAGHTPQQSLEKRDASPKMSERTNLLSALGQSDHKIGRMI